MGGGSARSPCWFVFAATGASCASPFIVPLHRRLTAVEQRSVLTHEITHAERDPAPTWARGRGERAADVDVVVVRCLIDLDVLADALLCSTQREEVADQRGVDLTSFRSGSTAATPKWTMLGLASSAGIGGYC